MAKWINRNTNKIGTFGAEKRGNKSNEFNKNLRIFEKMKDVLAPPDDCFCMLHSQLAVGYSAICSVFLFILKFEQHCLFCCHFLI